MEGSAFRTLRKSWPAIAVATALATLLLALLHDTYLARAGAPSKGLEALESEMRSEFGDLEFRDGEIRPTAPGAYEVYLELLGHMCPTEPALQEIRSDLENANRADLRAIRESAAAVRQILRGDHRGTQQPLLFRVKTDTESFITELARKASARLEAFGEINVELMDGVCCYTPREDSEYMDHLVDVAEQVCRVSRVAFVLICTIPNDEKLVEEFVAEQQAATRSVCTLRALMENEGGQVTKETLDKYIASMRRRLDSMRRRLSDP